jgi:hypothetical protein
MPCNALLTAHFIIEASHLYACTSARRWNFSVGLRLPIWGCFHAVDKVHILCNPEFIRCILMRRFTDGRSALVNEHSYQW